MYLVSNQVKIQHLGDEAGVPKDLAFGLSETAQIELFAVNADSEPEGFVEAVHHGSSIFGCLSSLQV